jgi:SpoVK/Ycf46/Vps4 family AAA+-type ATPase
MATPTEVIAALEAAVAAAPGETALRLHLAELLANAGEGTRALVHVRTLLAADPSNVPALKLFARLQSSSASANAGTEDDDDDDDDENAENEADDDESDDTDRDLHVAPVATLPSAKGTKSNVVQLSVLSGGKRTRDEDSPFFELERPEITLADVAGMGKVKERLVLSFLAPMKQPELRRLYGKKLRGGLLLYGPPGCGKTYIARAVAGEMNARFFSIGIADVLSKWLGESEGNVKSMFEVARRNKPCVIFLDELDAIGHKRSQLTSSSHSVVNQLLDEMDSVGKDNEGIFVLAATNHPWDVDAALRRPGRLDRSVLVLPPDEAARRRVLELGLQDRPVEGVDLDDLARRTNGYSGADLTHLVDSAAELAMAHAVKTGKVRPIGSRDFAAALKDVRPTTQAWFDTAKNYALYANEGGLYDDLLAYLKRR